MENYKKIYMGVHNRYFCKRFALRMGKWYINPHIFCPLLCLVLLLFRATEFFCLIFESFFSHIIILQGYNFGGVSGCFISFLG